MIFRFGTPLTLVPETPYVIEWESTGGGILYWAGAVNSYTRGNIFYTDGTPDPNVDLMFTTYRF